MNGRGLSGATAGAAASTGGGGGAGVSFAAGAVAGLAGLAAAGGAEAGGVEAGGGAAAGVADGAAGAGMTALTAVLQAPESLPMLRLRHSKASAPPGCTPEQFAMKSERQDARIALV